jgi:hypothetical protein
LILLEQREAKAGLGEMVEELLRLVAKTVVHLVILELNMANAGEHSRRRG